MASHSHNVKNPPRLEGEATYEQWEKKVELWQAITDLKAEQQGPALVLALNTIAQDEVLELDTSIIKSATGVKEIKKKLAAIYKKDAVDSAYEAFENFIEYKRPEDMKMKEFTVEFEKRHVKAKKHGCELSSDILAYFLLNQAQLTTEKKELIKATVGKLAYEDMKTKLLKVFGGVDKDSTASGVTVKVEEIRIADEEALYGRDYQYGSYRGQNRYQRNRGGFRARYQQGQNRGYHRRGMQPSRGTRPPQLENKKPRCNICESIYHFARDCPEKVYFNQEEDTYDIVLYQSNLITPKDYSTFIAEASVAAILDSGASSSVAGKKWMESYLDGLPEGSRQKV